MISLFGTSCSHRISHFVRKPFRQMKDHIGLLSLQRSVKHACMRLLNSCPITWTHRFYLWSCWRQTQLKHGIFKGSDWVTVKIRTTQWKNVLGNFQKTCCCWRNTVISRCTTYFSIGSGVKIFFLSNGWISTHHEEAWRALRWAPHCILWRRAARKGSGYRKRKVDKANDLVSCKWTVSSCSTYFLCRLPEVLSVK